MGGVRVVALDANSVSTGRTGVDDVEGVGTHDERVVRREGQILCERGLLIDVVPVRSEGVSSSTTDHVDRCQRLHSAMGGVGNGLVSEAREEPLADESVLQIVRRSQSRGDESRDGEQRSCRTHGEKESEREGKDVESDKERWDPQDLRKKYTLDAPFYMYALQWRSA